MKLTEIQIYASNQLIENYKKNQNTYLEAVCGAGKTEIVAELIKYALTINDSIAFAIPRTELVKELGERLQALFRNKRVTLVYGGHTSELEGDIVVCTTHQLYRYKNHFDLVILDEMDAFPFCGNQELMIDFIHSSKGNYVVMSATSNEYTQHLVQTISALKVEVNQRYHQNPMPVPKCKYTIKALRYVALFLMIKKLLPKPIIIFVSTFKKQKQLMSIMKYFYNINAINSQTKNKETIIQMLKNRTIDCLVSTSLLERGITYNDLQVIIFDAHDRLFETTMLIQMAGRVGRKEETPNGEIVFITQYHTKAIEACIHEIKKKNETMHHLPYGNHERSFTL